MTTELQWGPIPVQNGKYTFQCAEDGWSVDVLRYGKPWLNIKSGHKAILALAFEVEALRETIAHPILEPRYFCTTKACGECAGCKAAAARVQEVFQEAEVQLVETMCSECGSPQFSAPGGTTCENGHGGAEGVEPPASSGDALEARPFKVHRAGGAG